MQITQDFLGLGIAGNFALHLAQAGELEEFKEIITAEEAAPKGMFPFFLPHSHSNKAKKILKTFPLSSELLNLPKEDVNVQAEPEVGLVCTLEYAEGKVSKITPTHFGAYNDASIRVAGANKISDKKNWGTNSKGVSQTLFPIDKFKDGGIMDTFSICSFLQRGEEVYAYGENVALHGYSYFYEKLTDWMQNQLNTQEDFGPLEHLSTYIKDSSYPTQALISIGATRYTPYGEKTFLQEDDTVFVVVYNSQIHTFEEIQLAIENEDYNTQTMSILKQKVVK